MEPEERLRKFRELVDMLRERNSDEWYRSLEWALQDPPQRS